MANPAQLKRQIRFALSQLPDHNAHHVFEDICRFLTRQFICSNILPATGPVSAGGDQGRDFETFRSYLHNELDASSGFLGLISEGTIAFLCTTQASNLTRKLAADIEKVCSSGHPVYEIKAFSLLSIPVADRHKVENELREAHDLRLELFDAEAIAELLATHEGFWIAEQFLAMPAEVGPLPQQISETLSHAYIDRRTRWREKQVPNATLGDFVDIKAGLREATFEDAARADFPFWLGLLRELLANPSLPPAVLQRARYELIVANLRGFHNMATVDEVAREYLETSLSENEPARLEDASVLLMYTAVARRDDATTISSAEITAWNVRFRRRIEQLLPTSSGHRRASLLFTLGYLAMNPALPQDPSAASQDNRDTSPADKTPSHLSGCEQLPEEDFVDLSFGLSVWLKLAEGLDDTPLFPVDSLTEYLRILAPLLVDHSEWRLLVDRVDAATARAHGKAAIAHQARGRAMELLRAGRMVDAIEELHQAKIDWWSGDTIRGSLLAMLVIADLYLELRLPQAAKAYALAAAYVGTSGAVDELSDLVPQALFSAAKADYISGAWCSTLSLIRSGVVAQYNFVEGGLATLQQEEVNAILLHLAWITRCAYDVGSDLTSSVSTAVHHLGIETEVNELINCAPETDRDFWESFGSDQLTNPPFSDVGDTRYIRFAALGTNWTLESANDNETVRMAERFAAAAQVMLAALAREDLCIVPTHISVRIEHRQPAAQDASSSIEPIPSNDGRRWVAALLPIMSSDSVDPEQIDQELVTILSVILLELSLLERDEFFSAIERAFQRGIKHKLSPVRPYDELSTMFQDEGELEIERRSFDTPWSDLDRRHSPHTELRWQERHRSHLH